MFIRREAATVKKFESISVASQVDPRRRPHDAHRRAGGKLWRSSAQRSRILFRSALIWCRNRRMCCHRLLVPGNGSCSSTAAAGQQPGNRSSSTAPEPPLAK